MELQGIEQTHDDHHESIGSYLALGNVFNATALDFIQANRFSGFKQKFQKKKKKPAPAIKKPTKNVPPTPPPAQTRHFKAPDGSIHRETRGVNQHGQQTVTHSRGPPGGPTVTITMPKRPGQTTPQGPARAGPQQQRPAPQQHPQPTRPLPTPHRELPPPPYHGVVKQQPGRPTRPIPPPPYSGVVKQPTPQGGRGGAPPLPPRRVGDEYDSDEYEDEYYY